MGRHTSSHELMHAGSSRLRLDPYALPVRYTAPDSGADGHIRLVEISRERVRLQRLVRGMRMAFNVPLSTFQGVAIGLVPGKGKASPRMSVTLEHVDPDLSVPLHIAADSDDIIAEWYVWARVLGQKLLVRDRDGKLHTPVADTASLHFDRPHQRRRRHNGLRGRRPLILMLRPAAQLPDQPLVHNDEREIIART